jgi:RNA polymerase sigma-70 factor (ECF subfamily)
VQRGRQQLRTLLTDCCHLDFDGRGNVVDYQKHGRCRRCGEC